MKKALNFDLDTKEYEKATGRSAPTAYYKIRNFLERNGFEHRQGSGYISKTSMDFNDANNIVIEMSVAFPWLKDCVRKFDITNVGKKLSFVPTIKNEVENIEQNKNSIDMNEKVIEPDISNK